MASVWKIGMTLAVVASMGLTSVSCATTEGGPRHKGDRLIGHVHETKAQRRQRMQQQKALGAALGVLVIGAAVAGMAAASSGGGYYNPGPVYRGNGYGGGGSRCRPMYSTPNPTNDWGPGHMCAGN